MTNLSKELCEICGIKPRYGVYQNFGDLDNDYRLVTNVRKCRLIADTRFNVDDEDGSFGGLSWLNKLSNVGTL